MSAQTECPKCQNKFLVKRNLKYRLRPKLSFMKLAFRNITFPWIDGLEEVYKPNLVACPECGKEFSATGYKYFGFIDARQLQIGLLLAFLIFIFAFIGVLILGSMK